MISFRGELFKAKVVDKENDDIIVKYYRGFILRTRDIFPAKYLKYEAKKPAFFSNL